MKRFNIQLQLLSTSQVLRLLPLLLYSASNSLPSLVITAALRLTRLAALTRRSYHPTPPTLKRRFTPILPLKMDLSALSTRLSALSLAPSTATETTPLLSYFFTPKSGSKHPDNAEQDLKLVVVSLEQSKNLGAAKALAAQVGLKDMRAVSGADLDKLIGRKREEGKSSSTLWAGQCVFLWSPIEGM